MKSYFEEFERNYNKPRMENITVGFSGIDPTPKALGEVKDVSIDAGEITLDSGEIH